MSKFNTKRLIAKSSSLNGMTEFILVQGYWPQIDGARLFRDSEHAYKELVALKEWTDSLEPIDSYSVCHKLCAYSVPQIYLNEMDEGHKLLWAMVGAGWFDKVTDSFFQSDLERLPQLILENACHRLNR